MAHNRLEEVIKEAVDNLVTIVQIEETLEKSRVKTAKLFQEQVFKAVGREPIPVENEAENKEFSDWLESEGYKIITSQNGGIEKGILFFILERNNMEFITGCRMEWTLEQESETVAGLSVRAGRMQPKSGEAYRILKTLMELGK